MKRVIFGSVILVSLMILVSHASQNTRSGQRLYFQIGIPAGQQAKLLLPDSKVIDLSALSLERNSDSVMHLKGSSEIRFKLIKDRVAVIRTDEATYNLNTAELQINGPFKMTEENAR